MGAVIPWPRLVALIAPHYPKAGKERQPVGLERMLRIYFLPQWFNLSDPAAEAALSDREAMRRLAGVGDRQYWTASGGEYLVNRRGTRSRPLTGRQRLANRHRSRARARGEHPLQVIKPWWGFTKVRFRGLAKNRARAYTLFGLANLYRVRQRLLPRGFVPCVA